MQERRIVEAQVVGPAAEMASETPPPPTIGERPAAGTPEAYVPAIAPGETYTPQLVLDPTSARQLVEDIRMVQRSVLREGTDYGHIPGVRGNPVLLKPGAERLLQVFGLGHRMEVMEVLRDTDGRPFGVTYRCTVTKMLTDGREITVSSCDGHASSDEPKWRKAPWNTIIKMAQKRALVGACLTATATSGLFTQDMEDYAVEHPQTEQRPQPREDGPAPREFEDPDGPLTRNQLRMLATMFGKLNITDRDERLNTTKAIIGREIESSKDLTKREASTVIDTLVQAEAKAKGEEA